MYDFIKQKDDKVKRYTPLFILAIFAAGIIFMVFGMKNALELSDPNAKKTERPKG
jgi:NADH:ubiquinone oxidoreductase subunit 3 (subunit A)